MNTEVPIPDPVQMPYSKLLLLSLLAGSCLGGCVYDEYDDGYQQPRRVYNSGYVQRDVIVESRPGYYYEGGRYYRNDQRYDRNRSVYDRGYHQRSDWDNRQHREHHEDVRVQNYRSNAENERRSRENYEEARVKSYQSNTEKQRIEREKKEEEKVRGYREAFARQQAKQREQEQPGGKKKKKKDKDDD